MAGENSSFYSGNREKKTTILPQQLPHVGREPPTTLNHTHSINKQDVVKEQPLLETVTFISKSALPWNRVRSDYSVT